MKLAKRNNSKLRDIKAPAGVKKVYKHNEIIVRKPIPNEMIIGMKGAKLKCLEKCDIAQFHGFADGISFE